MQGSSYKVNNLILSQFQRTSYYEYFHEERVEISIVTDDNTHDIVNCSLKGKKIPTELATRISSYQFLNASQVFFNATLETGLFANFSCTFRNNKKNSLRTISLILQEYPDRKYYADNDVIAELRHQAQGEFQLKPALNMSRLICEEENDLFGIDTINDRIFLDLYRTSSSPYNVQSKDTYGTITRNYHQQASYGSYSYPSSYNNRDNPNNYVPKSRSVNSHQQGAYSPYGSDNVYSSINDGYGYVNTNLSGQNNYGRTVGIDQRRTETYPKEDLHTPEPKLFTLPTIVSQVPDSSKVKETTTDAANRISPNANNSPMENTGVLVGVILGAIIGGVAITIISILAWRCWNKSQRRGGNAVEYQRRINHNRSSIETHYETIPDTQGNRKPHAQPGIDITLRPPCPLPPGTEENPYLHYDTVYEQRIFRLGLDGPILHISDRAQPATRIYS